MTTDLATTTGNGELATSSPDDFQLLDHVAGGLVAPRRQIPVLGTISAGYLETKNGRTYPAIGRDAMKGKIFVNGQAKLAASSEALPGLCGVLNRTGCMRLTIALTSDDIGRSIQQRFGRYSTTALELYGDENSIRRIRTETRRVTNKTTGEVKDVQHPIYEEYLAGTPEYAQAVGFCKTQTSLYFVLAEWDAKGQARVIFPDGVGLYRLRMTSRNSAHCIVASLRWMAQLTGGRLAGLPFDLYIVHQEVAGPDGKRREVPVWQTVPKLPKPVELTSANFREIIGGALAQGENLRVLPAPTESIEWAAIEGSDVDLDDPAEPPMAEAPAPSQRDVDMALRGGLVDKTSALKRFFGTFKGTALATDEGRHEFIREASGGQKDSLASLIDDYSEQEFQQLIARGQLYLNARAKPRLEAELQHAMGSQPEDREDQVVDDLERTQRDFEAAIASAVDWKSLKAVSDALDEAAGSGQVGEQLHRLLVELLARREQQLDQEAV